MSILFADMVGFSRLREEQVPHNIHKYGNTTAASIPLALDQAVKAGRVTKARLGSAAIVSKSSGPTLSKASWTAAYSVAGLEGARARAIRPTLAAGNPEPRFPLAPLREFRRGPVRRSAPKGAGVGDLA